MKHYPTNQANRNTGIISALLEYLSIVPFVATAPIRLISGMSPSNSTKQIPTFGLIGSILSNLALNVEKGGISPNVRRPADKGRERADVANVVVARLLAEAAHINGILTKIRHWIPASRLSFGATRESPGANDSFRIKNSVTAEFLSKPTAEPREALSRRLHCAFLQLQNSSY